MCMILYYLLNKFIVIIIHGSPGVKDHHRQMTRTVGQNQQIRMVE